MSLTLFKCLFILAGAQIHVQGIKHPVSTTKSGEYWKLLMPGTHLISASYKNLKTDKVIRSKSQEVKILENNEQKTTAIRLDFEL